MAPESNPPNPPAGDPPNPPAGGEVDDAKLGAAVEAAIRKLFAESKPAGGDPPPATPPASGQPAGQPAASSSSDAGSIGGMIAAAVNAALKERDQEDALAVLAGQIDDLKKAITAAPPARKRGWGSILLGPGSLSR